MILSFFRLLRFLVGWVDLIVLWLIFYPLSFLPSKLTQKFYPRLFQYWCRKFVDAMGVDLKVHQKNKRRLPKQYIVISNHPSCFEDVGMSACFNARFLAKHEVEKWWFVGRMAKAGGALFVRRESKEDRAKAAEAMQEALANGDNIGIYPEGGCKGRRIHTPFRYGIFDVSIQADVPIIPVFLHHESQEDFEWLHQHLLVKIWKIMTSQNRRVNYYVYDAVYPSQFNTKQEYTQYMQDLYLDWQKRYFD